MFQTLWQIMPFPDFSIISREELDAFINLETLRVQPIQTRIQVELNNNQEQWEDSTRTLTSNKVKYDQLTEQLHNPRRRHSARAQQARIKQDISALLHLRKLLEMIRLNTQDYLEQELFPLEEAKAELYRRLQSGTD